jgi:hypothetical protein
MAKRKRSPLRPKRLARASSRSRRIVRRIVVRRLRKAKRGLPPSAEKSPIQMEATAQHLAERNAPPHDDAASSERTDEPSRFWAPVGAWVLVLGVASVALLAAGLPSSTRPDTSSDERVRELDADYQLSATTPSKQTQATSPRTAPVKSTESPEPIESHLADSRRADTQTLLAESKAPSVAAFAGLPAAEPAAIAPRDETPLVTLSGCLESDDDEFRLKNASGAEAPKSRSWKTGFLTKRSSDVTVAANRLDLRSHVGRRVTLTGELADRRLQVRSLQPSAVHCD